MKPGVFLDRDGTVIEHVHHLTQASDVSLIQGAAAAITKLRSAGYKCVIVTNQSVVGRGMLSEAGLEDVHREMTRQLREEDTDLDAIYWCPIAPQQRDQRVIEHPDRKPGPGMLLRGAKELGIDLGSSYMIGDSLSDLVAGRNAGCLASLLVRTGYGEDVEKSEPNHGYAVFDDLAVAADAILENKIQTS